MKSTRLSSSNHRQNLETSGQISHRGRAGLGVQMDEVSYTAHGQRVCVDGVRMQAASIYRLVCG